MRAYCYVLVLVLTAFNSSAQSYFDQAYAQFPSIPKGVLEAVSFTQTRMNHLTEDEPEGCSGIPKAYGMMGLTLDGKNYFKENLKLVAERSGISIDDIIHSVHLNVKAYASAFDQLLNNYYASNPVKSNGFDINAVAFVLAELSEIPDSGYVNGFARDCQLYAILTFLNNPEYSATYNFPKYNIDLNSFFGNNRYSVLTAEKVVFTEYGILANGIVYPLAKQTRSAQYAPAIWTPAPSCNYSSRAGTPVSAITIHTVQGSYAGAISWAQNCSSSVSYHYVIRSSDGQVTQMVDEANKAWHVGSENPYTIGYEHEGYVTSPSWYTTAMYNASADLSRDICSSGYGINPLRTYYGASSSSTVTLGSCTKIKGHQHYPSQTHTDPGIYWDWKRYYLLINNSPSITTVSTTSGTFYDSGGAGADYSDDERKLTLFQPAGASSVSLTFTQFDLETNWDYMFIYDGANTSSTLMGTYTGTSGPGTITSTGGNLLVEFRSDCNTTNPGWVANFTSGGGGSTSDIIAPTTALTAPSTWVSNDFSVSFSDADNTGGSGVEKSFYQVIDFDGTDWRANANRGFFSDNFDLTAIHPEWTTVTGTWNITSGALTQSDESLTNTNIYAFLNHSLSNRYLYNWSGKLEGSGTNRRAGFHYFCDNPTLTNRGNSYFVWFRLDSDAIEIYKVTSDVFSLVSTTPYNFNAAQWYDFKVTYDRITGLTQVFIDNVLEHTWTDTSPYSSGNYVSFRSGNSNWAINNFKVYRSRATTATVLVGPGGDLRYQNSNPVTPAGRIKTMINDNAGNLSSLVYQDINVDTTSPILITQVNDGNISDVDSWTSTNNATAYWNLTDDTHSGIVRYWYALGTTPGGTDVVNWTDNGWYDSVAVTGLSLSVGTTYYFSVKAENAAGLLNLYTSSDGFTIVAPSLPPVAGFYALNTIVCNDECITFSNTSSDATNYQWTFTGGDISSSTLPNPTVCYGASGNYSVTLIANGPGGDDTTTQTISVTVYNHPSAAFSMSTDTAYTPSAFVGFTNTSVDANGYYWDFGDGNTSTNEDPWNIYNLPGTYTVMMVALNGPCENDTTYSTVTVLTGTGINSSENVQVYLYPNPVTEMLYIKSNSTELIKVLLFDAIGKNVLKKEFLSVNEIAIDVMNFSSGVYQLEIHSGNSVLQRTIIKR